MISWVILLFKCYLCWPRWVRKKVMNWFSTVFFVQDLGLFIIIFLEFLTWTASTLKNASLFQNILIKIKRTSSPLKHLWCLEDFCSIFDILTTRMEGFKSHKNKEVQENYEIPMVKRNKDSTAFFALLRIRIIPYCKIQITVLNGNRNEGFCAVQEWI